MEACPCGSGKGESTCCGSFINNDRIPTTPEELMRSRYTAYVRLNLAYIAATMKPPASNHFNKEITLQWASQLKWLGLEVIQSRIEKNRGWVEFKAYYQEQGQKHCLHERSKFERGDDTRWYYMDSQTPSSRISRNDPCPCGSNKKYKKCCGV